MDPAWSGRGGGWWASQVRSGLRRGARPRQGGAPLRKLRQGSGPDTTPGLLSSERGITRKLDIRNVIDIFNEKPRRIPLHAECRQQGTSLVCTEDWRLACNFNSLTIIRYQAIILFCLYFIFVWQLPCQIQKNCIPLAKARGCAPRCKYITGCIAFVITLSKRWLFLD